MIAAVAVWALLVFFYAANGWYSRGSDKASYPVQCCFVGLSPVSTMLVAFAILPYNHLLATLLFAAGALGQRSSPYTARARCGPEEEISLPPTPVLYLPTVAENFVSVNLASALGFGDLAAIFFNAGLSAWIALEIHFDAQAVRARPAGGAAATHPRNSACASRGRLLRLSVLDARCPGLRGQGAHGLRSATGTYPAAIAAVDHGTTVRGILPGLTFGPQSLSTRWFSSNAEPLECSPTWLLFCSRSRTSASSPSRSSRSGWLFAVASCLRRSRRPRGSNRASRRDRAADDRSARERAEASDAWRARWIRPGAFHSLNSGATFSAPSSAGAAGTVFFFAGSQTIGTDNRTELHARAGR